MWRSLKDPVPSDIGIPIIIHSLTPAKTIVYTKGGGKKNTTDYETRDSVLGVIETTTTITSTNKMHFMHIHTIVGKKFEALDHIRTNSSCSLDQQHELLCHQTLSRIDPLSASVKISTGS